VTTQVRKSGQTAILVVEGKLSIGAAVDEFRDRWSEAVAAGAHDIVLDLSRVPIIDSSGIGSMIKCHSVVSKNGGKLKLVGAHEIVRQAFKMTRLDSVFEFYDKESDALAQPAAKESASD
jgi:anti-sigma B factor antagonist